ncbi:hypothetical protein J3F84DRAFT_282732 [Trichoderma pleuroticola]
MLRSGPHRLGAPLFLSLSLSLSQPRYRGRCLKLRSTRLSSAHERPRDETRCMCMQKEYGKIRSTFVPQKNPEPVNPSLILLLSHASTWSVLHTRDGTCTDCSIDDLEILHENRIQYFPDARFSPLIPSTH